jgi:hypothetical protein
VSVLTQLWPEVDRVALCIHRPSAEDPGFRALVARLGLPAGSIVVGAARYLAAGRVTLTDLELLGRYDSRSLIAANVERHVEAGFLERVGERQFAPTPAFRDAARSVLDLQVQTARRLWDGAPVTELADLVSNTVAAVQRTVPTPAFDGQVAHHHVTPDGAVSEVLARVTELRYLRADLHAAALAEGGFAGPRARAVTRVWKGYPASDRDGQLLADRDLATSEEGRWRLTAAAREARDAAELLTDELTAGALKAVTESDLSSVLRLMRTLPGEDPRPTEDR